MPQTTLHIETFTLSDLMTNCYFVHDGDVGWLVDVGFQPEAMLHRAAESGVRIEKIVLTHAHADHIAGLGQARERFPDAPVMIHPDEQAFLTDANLNLSAPFGMPITFAEAEQTLEPGQMLTLGDSTFEVRHTPGHSPGGVSLIAHDQGKAIVGDALFAGSIGRTDFPTSDHDALIRGIREQLLTLPDDTMIHPGHGPTSTIGQERRTNPFLQ
jgi:hydroxyacylglutathione hydrolase